MAWGIPLLGSDIAFEGLEVVNGSAFLDKDLWVKQLKLLTQCEVLFYRAREASLSITKRNSWLTLAQFVTKI